MPPRPATPSIRHPAKSLPVESSATAQGYGVPEPRSLRRMGPITFAGGTLDRASERRAHEAWVDAARSDPRARAVVAGRGGVLVDGERPSPGADAWAAGSGGPLTPRLVPLDDREPMLLGLDGDGAPLWVVDADDGEE